MVSTFWCTFLETLAPDITGMDVMILQILLFKLVKSITELQYGGDDLEYLSRKFGQIHYIITIWKIKEKMVYIKYNITCAPFLICIY